MHDLGEGGSSGNSRDALQNGFDLNVDTLLTEQSLTGMTYSLLLGIACAHLPPLGGGGHGILLPVQHLLGFKNTQDHVAGPCC